MVSVQKRLCARLRPLRSPAPVQKNSESSHQTAISGVTWGRPSGLTVEIQKSSAVSSTACAALQGVALACASL